MAKKTNPPSIKKTAFECPTCGAYTTQFWYRLYAKGMDHENPLPKIPKKESKLEIENILKEKISKRTGEIEEIEEIKSVIEWFNKMETGLVFFDKRGDTYPDCDIYNLYISSCYDCGKKAVWVHDNIVFPPEKQGVQPNQDLPEDIINDFEEARSIVGLSPRGATALLRLCVQKLCKHLGEKGKNINEDIANLVKKGLNPLVQKSLDIVRVIGGEAVHPGVIDLNDDRDTANQLFELINSIAEQMISHPKTVQELYGKLPETKRNAIEKRNGKNNQKS